MATKLKAQDIDTTETFVLSASQFGNGSVTSPSITFSSDPNTGIYNFGADQLAITTGGVLRWVIDQNGTMYSSTSQGIQHPDGSVATPSMNFTLDTDTGFYRQGNNTLGISAGGIMVGTINATALQMQNNNTDNNLKVFRIGSVGYSNSSAFFPLTYATASGAPGTNDSAITIGGGTSSGYATNFIYFNTAANDTTVVGTTRAQVTPAGQFEFSDGSASAPSLSFISDPDTGFYRQGANSIGFATGGTLIGRIEGGNGAGTTNSISVTNSDNTNTASHSRVYVSSGGSSGGDSFIQVQVPGVTTFNFGVDNSDSDILAFYSQGSTLGSGTFVTAFTPNAVPQMISADGTAALPFYSFYTDQDTGIYRAASNDLRFTAGGNEIFQMLLSGTSRLARVGAISNPGNSNILGVYNDSDTASSSANLDIWVGGGSSSDPYLRFGIGGPTRSWSFGVDNSDNDTLKWDNVVSSSTPGAGTVLALTIGGQLQSVDGTSSNPSFSFINQPSVGIYRPASNTIGFVLGSSAATWQMDGNGLRPPAIDAGTTYSGFGERRILNLGTTTDITPDIDASGFIQVRTFNNVNTASNTALYYWWSSATDAGITTIVAPTGSGGPTINSVTIVAPRTIRFNIGSFSGGSAQAFFVKLHNG